MKDNWVWIGKYLIVIIAALVLGAVLAGAVQERHDRHGRDPRGIAGAVHRAQRCSGDAVGARLSALEPVAIDGGA